MPADESAERQPDFMMGGGSGEGLPVYIDDTLPDDPDKRAQCEAHIRGILGEAMNSFVMAGCDFDVAQRDGEVNLVLACKGLSRFGRKCGLRLSQVSKDGEVVNSAKLA